VHPDGQTIDLTWTNNGVEYHHVSVSHTDRLKDTGNPLTPEAVRLRGLWATIQEHDKLREREEKERVARVKDAEAKKKEQEERTAIVRKKVMIEAQKEGADFAKIADNFGVMEADVRDWALTPASV
jgi:Fic family protein